jgi:hypothetical protein
MRTFQATVKSYPNGVDGSTIDVPTSKFANRAGTRLCLVAKKRFQNLALRGVSRFAQRIAAANS